MLVSGGESRGEPGSITGQRVTLDTGDPDILGPSGPLERLASVDPPRAPQWGRQSLLLIQKAA